MNFWYSWQINYLLLLQQFREITGGVFDNFFLNITHGGETIIPAGIVAGIYWCLNTQAATYIFLNLGIGTFFSDLLKNIACIYRPWILDSRIHPVPDAIGMAQGYSFPSGHTQNAVSIWGTLAYFTQNKVFRACLIIFILLIAFSRNYLGVHTPQDVLFSLIFVTCLIFLMPKFIKWIDNGKNRDIVVFVCAILAVVACILFEHIKTYPLDYVNGKLLVNPVAMRLSSSPKLGLFLGIFTGWIINRRFIHFDGSVGTAIQKLFRFIIGAVIFYLIYFNLPDLLMNFMSKKYAWFFSSFVVVFYATVIYPVIILFVRKNILKTSE